MQVFSSPAVLQKSVGDGRLLNERSECYQALYAVSGAVCLPTLGVRRTGGRSARPQQIPRPSGVFGLLGLLVRPLPTVFSLDADDEKHL